MFEILKFFSLETAVRKNRSFRFFMRKYQVIDTEMMVPEPDPQHEPAGSSGSSRESKPIN
jgi:hypothetical protein